jgi:eukaryotic-like serine/threonine-protein kinase
MTARRENECRLDPLRRLAMSRTSVSPPPPSEIAQFEVVRRLGAGGMAEVFLAKKRGAEGTYKILVLKRILPAHGSSNRFRSMFIEEAHLATRLNHPNVVQVYEFQDFGDEGLLLAMEYVEGCDLGRLIATARTQTTRIPPWVGAWIIAEAAKGLHYAHDKKDEAGQPLDIVHRDVSPQNVLLSFDGAVKIADFGIASARLFAEETGVLKGKFGYMSPEQARGETVDRRSDLYALGVILWEILAGRPIHGGLGGEALLDIVRSGIVEPPTSYAKDIPPELAQITLRALSADRSERFTTGRELASTLGRAIVKQGELVDASALEATLALLVPHDARADSEPSSSRDGSIALRADDARTQAAVPLARSMAESRSSQRMPVAPLSLEEAASETPVPRRVAGPEGPREVRHVAVVTLHLHGLEAVVLPRRTLDQLRSILEDLAFKRGMRWVWTSDTDARAIAGLTANPSRAAIEAAQVALDVHETISGFKEDLPTPVAASIGIVRGIASGTREPQGHLVRYVLHDPATYLADVLGRSTPMGRTWVAGGVYRLVRRDFRWGDAPSLQLDVASGIDVPPVMRIYALERSLSREERLADVQATSSDLVGRDAEKADLHAAFHEAVSGGGGSGQLVCRAITGEMGIGKTALVATFLAELPPNARLVHVECTPVQMEVPFGAIAELVRAAIGTRGDEPFDEVAALIARAGGGAAVGADATSPMVARLTELATNRQGSGGDEDALARRKTILAGVRNLLAAIALTQPLVLVVEGTQWGDKASLEVLGEIVHASDPLPIFVLLVTRPDDRVLHVLAGVMRIELRGLTPEEQVRLVETRLGVREGVREVCAELLPKVGGNPFFLLEMVDALLERGALEIRENAAGDGSPGKERHSLVRTTKDGPAGTSLPSTLEQLVADRLAELPEEELTVVGWLATAGGPLSTHELETLLRATGGDAVMRLCARGLCDRKGDSIDFRHLLTRDVAYAALGGVTRARMHHALGELLAESKVAHGVSAAIVAQHFVRGEDGPRAADFYLEAAQAARTGYQTQQAIRQFSRAIGCMASTDPRAIVAHEALEAIHRDGGRRRERVRHLAALRHVAKACGTPRAVCLAFLRTARFDADEGKLAHGLPIARRAAEIARASGLTTLEVEAEALTSILQRELGDVQGALAACDRALAACDPKVHPEMPARARAEVLLARGALLRWVGRVSEAVDSHVDAIAIFRRAGARRQEARAMSSLAYAMFVQGRYEDTISLALASLQIDVEIGGRFQIAKTLANVGFAYARLGDVPRAQAYIARARDAHERYGDQDGRAETLLVSAQVMIEQGELLPADSLVRDAAALNAVIGNAYVATHEAVVRAALALARREPGAAIVEAMRARRLAEVLSLVSFQFYALAIEASARASAGELHAAVLHATTALGAVETLQGCEYGLEVRLLAADTLKRADSPQAALARQRAIDYAATLMSTIRDPRLRAMFAQRPLVARLLQATADQPVAAGALP